MDHQCLGLFEILSLEDRYEEQVENMYSSQKGF